MNHHPIHPDEAARALAEVAERRRQVTALVSPIPHWVPPVTAVLVFLRFAVMDLPHPASSILGLPLALSIVVVPLLVVRSRRVVLRRPMWGAAGWSAIVGYAFLSFVLFMVADWFLVPWDEPWTNTALGGVGAVLIGGGMVPLNWWLTRQNRRAAA